MIIGRDLSTHAEVDHKVEDGTEQENYRSSNHIVSLAG